MAEVNQWAPTGRLRFKRHPFSTERILQQEWGRMAQNPLVNGRREEGPYRWEYEWRDVSVVDWNEP
jgi:hypothetical protein